MRKYLGILCLSFVLIIVLCAMELEEKRNAEGTIEVSALNDRAEERGYELAYAPISVEGKSFAVGAWKETEENYVLFLPQWCQTEAGVEICATEQFNVDGKNISPGQSFFTKENQLVLEQSGERKILRIMFSSQIPSLWIETELGDISFVHESKEYVSIVESTWVDAEPGVDIISEKAEINCRGNVSFSLADKKSYLLNTQEPVDYGGMGAANKWVLTSNFFDQTQLRNYLTIQFAQRMGLAFTPEAEFVDLYIDGNYEGLFLLGEKVEVDPQRVDIRDLEQENEAVNGSILMKKYPYDSKIKRGFRAKSPDDIGGGYLLEFEMDERWEEEDSGFVTDEGQRVVLQSPKHATMEEVNYISHLFQEFEDARLDIESERYLEYIDLESFAKKYIIEEAAKNIDANKTSQFFYKYDDSISTKIYAGPIWDYDKGWGNMGKLDTNIDLRLPEAFYASEYIYPHSIWAELCSHASFEEEVKKIWRREASPLLGELSGELKQWEAKIAKSSQMDWVKWDAARREHDAGDGIYSKNYGAALEMLISFVEGRKNFLDGEW